jgi:hypothetical protein
MVANSQHDVPWSRKYGFALSMVFGIALALVGGLILLCSLSRPPAGVVALLLGVFTLAVGLVCPILGSIAYRASRAAIYGTMALWTIYLLLFNLVGMQLLDHNSAHIPVMVTASSLLWAVYMVVLYRFSGSRDIHAVVHFNRFHRIQ